MGLPVMIERWVPHELGVRWVIVWERYKILTYKTRDEAIAAAKRLGYEVTNEATERRRAEDAGREEA